LVATYTFVNPVIAVFLGWAILSESFAASTLAGGGLVVISIIALLFFDPAPDEKTQGKDVPPKCVPLKGAAEQAA
jgi:drug/metabolite transporter (DMT)-like permease